MKIALLLLAACAFGQQFAPLPVPAPTTSTPPQKFTVKEGFSSVATFAAYSPPPKPKLSDLLPSKDPERTWFQVDGYEHVLVKMNANGRLEINPTLSTEELLRELLTTWLNIEHERHKREDAALESRDKARDQFHHFDPSKAPADADQHDITALNVAIRAWERALGMPLPIPRPKMFKGEKGSCAGTETAAACVLNGTGFTIVVESLDSEGASTELMHEIGHLLGVPHIVGDALMDATYSKPLSAPTDAAVALARLTIRKVQARVGNKAGVPDSNRP